MDRLRPPPPNVPRAGYHWEAVPDDGTSAGEWKLLDGKPCRMQTKRVPCGKPSVAALNRQRRVGRYPNGPRDEWWAYCAEHLYGRWIEGDRVMRWALRRNDG